MNPSRRQLLKGLSAATLWTLAPPAFASADSPRLVVVILRGGMDGLHAVPAIGDPAYRTARGAMALPPGAPLPLDGTFALHPSLAPLMPLWDAEELLVAHAVAMPYRGRSHFDAQDRLETGVDDKTADGWLGRALASMPDAGSLGLGSSLPRILRGAPGATAVDPTGKADPHRGFTEALADLYADDKLLGPALASGLEARDRSMGAMGRVRGDSGRALLRAAGKLLSGPMAPTTAVMSLGGWDSHARQGALDGRLADLAEGLVGLRDELGAAWSHTAVLVLTEFGRTVAANGTGGTDHGTAGAALLVGGAVRGGRVLSDWPGLSRTDLLEGRDLRPTLDTRALMAGVLHEHLGVTASAIGGSVFPGLEQPLEHLIRGASSTP